MTPKRESAKICPKSSRRAIYLAVDPRHGTDALAARAETLGGTVLLPPFDTGFGRAAVLADPSGARFAITDRSRRDPDWRAEVEDPYDD